MEARGSCGPSKLNVPWIAKSLVMSLGTIIRTSDSLSSHRCCSMPAGLTPSYNRTMLLPFDEAEPGFNALAVWGAVYHDPRCNLVHVLAGMLLVERGTLSFRM